MKKFSRCLLAFLFSFVIAFVSFPFYSFAQSSNNSIVNPWDNTIDFLRCQLGVLNAQAGSIAGVSRLDFYSLLYDVPLIYNGSQFTPSSIFNSSEWVNACNSSSATVNGKIFNILDCLAESSILVPDSSGNYTVSSDLLLRDHGGSSGSFNSAKPLDGIEIITNFSDYNGHFSELARPSYSEQFVNSAKQQYISEYGNCYIISAPYLYSNDSLYAYTFRFYSIPNNSYCYFIKNLNSDNSYTYQYKFYDNGWKGGSSYVVYYAYASGNNSKDYYYFPNVSTTYLNIIPFSDLTYKDTSLTNSSMTNNLNYNFYRGTTPNFWGNIPLVLASSDSVGQNYFYWLNNSPSGYYYTTTNVNNVFTSDYVNNTNWEQTYNNYITDVSNYYSTTENITNEQLSQYIDNSTTITNITNNYITNNNGGGDDIITNSWLERIYNKLVEIKSILLGRGDPDDNSDYITDNGIKNDILHAPASDLFPDVPVEDFISDSEDFTVDLFATKLSTVLAEAIPFCYIYILGEVADDLKATPSPPYWEIPFTIDRLNIDENLTLDMTSSDWDSVHNVWIALFMIIFVSYLFYLSYRVIMLVSNLFA